MTWPFTFTKSLTFNWLLSCDWHRFAQKEGTCWQEAKLQRIMGVSLSLNLKSPQ